MASRGAAQPSTVTKISCCGTVSRPCHAGESLSPIELAANVGRSGDLPTTCAAVGTVACMDVLHVLTLKRRNRIPRIEWSAGCLDAIVIAD